MSLDVITDVLVQILILAVIAEAVVEVIKTLIPARYLTSELKQQISVATGVTLAMVSPFTLFPGGAIAFQVAGKLLVGLLIGRGSNGIHDLIKILRGLAQILASKAEVMQAQKK